jgi:hypothetical protein
MQPIHTVILAPGTQIPVLNTRSNAAANTVTIARDDQETVDPTVASQGSGILVLGDAYARLDGAGRRQGRYYVPTPCCVQ